MMSITRISIDQAKEMLRTRADVQIVDIRDAHAYGAAHIPGSIHLSEQNLEQFIQETQSDIALIVMCYHGISSQSASAYLSNRGFSETYSLDGGFDKTHQGLVDDDGGSARLTDDGRTFQEFTHARILLRRKGKLAPPLPWEKTYTSASPPAQAVPSCNKASGGSVGSGV